MVNLAGDYERTFEHIWPYVKEDHRGTVRNSVGTLQNIVCKIFNKIDIFRRVKRCKRQGLKDLGASRQSPHFQVQ